MADSSARTGPKRTIKPAPVRRSIEVNAPQAKAFEVFTRKTSAWWPKSASRRQVRRSSRRSSSRR